MVKNKKTMLAPHIKLTENKLFLWSDRKHRVFDVMEVLMASTCINNRPYYTKSLHIYINVSAYQPGGAVVIRTVWQINQINHLLQQEADHQHIL